jgi:hypothetical protein
MDKKMDLKERAIYQLPNGRELVAQLNGEGKAILQNVSASDPDKYELNDEGRLLFNGQLTAWGVNDLVDTGRVASPDMTAVLHESWVTEPERRYENP